MEGHEERLSTRAMADAPAMRDDAATAQASASDDVTATEMAAREESAEVASLLPHDEETDLRRRWEEIQTRFVDDPRRAVEDADALVAGVMKSLAEGFAQAREQLERQSSRGEDVSTEDLRVALQRYRSFFQ